MPGTISTRRKIITSLACAATAALGLVAMDQTPAAAQQCSTSTTVSNQYGSVGGVGYKTTTPTKTCIKKTSSTRSFVIGWKQTFNNDTPYPATHTCKVTEQVTVTYTTSAEIGATWKATALLELKAGISAGLSTSLSSGLDISTTITVPGKKSVYCESGLWKWTFKGTKTVTTTVDKTVIGWGTRVSGYPKTTTVTSNFTASAPEANSRTFNWKVK
ncbi:MAG: hypothetical protein LBR19_06585 [Bifidobacteriaceae bacterium]|jgi:hypothetical protein|nr:hypothetical protein [Bifidobacteriaceae bacterium]